MATVAAESQYPASPAPLTGLRQRLLLGSGDSGSRDRGAVSSCTALVEDVVDEILKRGHGTGENGDYACPQGLMGLCNAYLKKTSAHAFPCPLNPRKQFAERSRIAR